MGLFDALLKFRDKSAAKELEEEYSILNEIAADLAKILEILRNIQRETIESNKEISKKNDDSRTGELKYKKTYLIEEDIEELKNFSLIERLKNLQEFGEKKFNSIIENIKTTGAADAEEIIWLNNILKFLKELKTKLPTLNEIKDIKKLSYNKKLEYIEVIFDTVAELTKKYYADVEKYKKELKREVIEHEISPLLRNIYLNPKKKGSALVYDIEESELRNLEVETEKINNCGDKNFKIVWRGWWRDQQQFEIDKATPIKEPHVNMTIKLFGGPKKDIHLILKAA